MNLAPLSVLIHCSHAVDYELKIGDEDLMVDDEDMAYYDSDGGVAVGSRHFSNGSILKDDKMKIKIIDIADYVNQDKDGTMLLKENESEETEDLNDSAPDLWIKRHQVDDEKDDSFSKQMKRSGVHISINNFNSHDNSNVQIPEPQVEVAHHEPRIKIDINNFHQGGPILENITQKEQEHGIDTRGIIHSSMTDKSQRKKERKQKRKQEKKNFDYFDNSHISLVQEITKNSAGPIPMKKTGRGQENVIGMENENESFMPNSSSKREKGKTDTRKDAKMKFEPTDKKQRTRYIL